MIGLFEGDGAVWNVDKIPGDSSFTGACAMNPTCAHKICTYLNIIYARLIVGLI